MTHLVASQTPAYTLPHQTTSFIGRKADINRITDLLHQPTCRLMTIVGAGGMGKTRLAIEVATNLSAKFSDGCYFAPLQSTFSTSFLISAMAETVGLALSGSQEPLAQLTNYLSDKTMLLLLDNFEQLIDQGGPEVLNQILRDAPQIHLLVTSREVLNLQEEWLHNLHGLPVPGKIVLNDSNTNNIGENDAVALFLARAKRIQSQLSLADQAEAILHICQLVEGIPLAVELAASWTKTLSCQAIVAEIQNNLDFLVTPLRNLPNRHRSMTVVFDYSWQRLGRIEQHVFQRLSVFQGGFDRTAAAAIAEATLPILAALVDKSLLHLDEKGRYQIHELLRQYGQEKLREWANSEKATHEAHCIYFANFLNQRRIAIESGDQRKITLEINADLANVRAARQWASRHHHLPEIDQMIHAFALFCHFQSRYAEAVQAFEYDLACLESAKPSDEAHLIIADILVRVSWFYIRLGQYDEASSALTRSQAIYTTLKAEPYIAAGTGYLTPLAILAIIRGDSQKALKLAERARQFHQTRGDLQNLAFAYHALTSATLAQGDYQKAKDYAKQACEAAQTAGNQWYLAYCLNGWGNVALTLGNYSEAEQHFQASFQIREAFADPEGMAVALNHLGDVALRQGHFSQAEARFQRSLTIYQKVNDSGGLGAALSGLGEVACASQSYAKAAHYFQQALTIAAETQYLPLIGSLFISIGGLFLRVEWVEPAAILLSFIRQQPASEQEIKDRAEALLKSLDASLKTGAISATSQQAKTDHLMKMIKTIQYDLAKIISQYGADTERSTVAPPTNQPLIEPLTTRELEVLQLIALGHSNREIGEKLVLTVGSVKWYASQIYGKLQVKNRTEAVSKARSLNLISTN